MTQKRAMHYEQIQRITGVKLLDVLLNYIAKAKITLIAQYGIIRLPPELILKQAYVLVEESKIPHATKYRYKAFLRKLGEIFGYNIRVRKEKFKKTLEKLSNKTKPKVIIQKPTTPEPQFEESDHWNVGDEAFAGDYENIAQYYEWEE